MEFAGAAGDEDAAGSGGHPAVDVFGEAVVVDLTVGTEGGDGEEQYAVEHDGLLVFLM